MKEVKLPNFLTNPNPEIYRNGSYIALDFETSNSDKGSALTDSNRIVLAVWGKAKANNVLGRRINLSGYNHRFAGEFGLKELERAIAEVDFIICHNAKFELQWLKRVGVDISKVLVYDTMVAEKVLLGNRNAALDLDNVGRRYGIGSKYNLVGSLIHNGVSPERIPESLLLEYCRQDVWLTEEVFKCQMGQLIDNPRLAVVFTHCLLIPVLADIEANGLCLDPQRVQEEYERLSRRHAELSGELREFTGGINPRSGKQVGEFLYNILGFDEPLDYLGRPMRTNGDKPSTDAKAIAALKPKTSRQKRFVELKKEFTLIDTAFTKYINKFQECCANDNGIFTANFHQTRTATHRVSSTGGKLKVQLQNLDRDYKRLFKARQKGWLVGEADGAQLEFRVAAYLGQDRQAYSDIVNGVDVHAFTSKVLTENGEPTNRQDAKIDTFKPLYYGKSGTPARQAYYKAFRIKYPGISDTQEQWIEQVRRYKELETPWGMKFYWPDCKMTRSGFVTHSNDISCYSVQSLATAEIIPIGLVYFWHYLKELETQMFIVNTIHDSWITELPEEEKEVFVELSVKCLTKHVYDYLDCVYGIQFNIPLGAGIKIGEHWSEGEEVKINAANPPYNFGES